MEKKRIIFLLNGIWSFGIGLRFLVGHIEGCKYLCTSTWDMTFDWGVLTSLGLTSILIIIIDYVRCKYAEEKETHKE